MPAKLVDLTANPAPFRWFATVDHTTSATSSLFISSLLFLGSCCQRQFSTRAQQLPPLEFSWDQLFKDDQGTTDVPSHRSILKMMEAVIDPSTSPLMGRRQPPRTTKSLKPLDETQESPMHHDTPRSNGTAEDGSKSVNEEPPLPKRNLRKRRAESTVTLDPIEEAMKPLTDEERRNWKGWVELESDPVSLSIRQFTHTRLIQNFYRLYSTTSYGHMASRTSKCRKSSV